MDRTELLRLARLGAAARLTELQNEMDAIRRQFPDLGRGSASSADGDAEAVKHRRRRRLSAAARKRISEAQKARWAKQQALQKRPSRANTL